MERVVGTTRVTSETKSGVSSGPMSATVFFELLIRTVTTGRRRSTATRNIATEPRIGSKSEVNKGFDSSDILNVRTHRSRVVDLPVRRDRSGIRHDKFRRNALSSSPLALSFSITEISTF